MLKIGTSRELWDMGEMYPDIFSSAFSKHALKPLGHAVIAKYILGAIETREAPLKVLEIGHGATSPLFELFKSDSRVSLFGLDAIDVNKTVGYAGLQRLRQRYSSVEFYNGYLGKGESGLPDNTFDLVCSVSVIEHIPSDQLDGFHNELFKKLAEGGVQLHSYDRPFGGDINSMLNSVEKAGFSLMEPPERPVEKFWECSIKDLRNMVFENAYNVMEKFMFAHPRQGRRLCNWVTVILGAKK